MEHAADFYSCRTSALPCLPCRKLCWVCCNTHHICSVPFQMFSVPRPSLKLLPPQQCQVLTRNILSLSGRLLRGFSPCYWNTDEEDVSNWGSIVSARLRRYNHYRWVKQHYYSHSKVLPTNRKGQAGGSHDSWKRGETSKVTSTELKGVLSLCSRSGKWGRSQKRKGSLMASSSSLVTAEVPKDSVIPGNLVACWQ